MTTTFIGSSARPAIRTMRLFCKTAVGLYASDRKCGFGNPGYPKK